MSQPSPDDTVRGPRDLGHTLGKMITVIAATASLYHLYTAGFGAPEAMIHRSIHLMFIYPLIFFLYPFRKKSPRHSIQIIDVVSAGLALVMCLYIIWQNERLAWRFPYVDPTTAPDMILGAVAIILTLEATRRTVGWSLVVVALVFIGYAILGSYLPGYLAIRGVSPRLLLEQLYLLPEGIFGSMTGLSSTFVYLFILYGAFLKHSKVGDFLIDVALACVGWARGGPAKVAIFASAFFGTMSGSAVANVFATGTFTIPLMVSIGYRPFFSAAVEAAASTGGQIMPPVMGSAAFIMSDFTGIPYLNICVAALVPSLLYFFCIYVQLHQRALSTGLEGLPRESIPRLGKTIKRGFHLTVPVLAIVVLLAMRYTPHYAAFYGILCTIAVSMIRSHTRMKFEAFVGALKEGALNALSVAACLVCAGIVVGVTGLTGLGLKFTATIVYLSGGNLPLALVIISIVTIILGMGLPTPAAYLLVAIFGAPALIELGVDKLLAHLFCFYYAILSAVTPPIAMAAYAGAALARCDFIPTGFAAMKLAAVGYIVPFVFVFNPALVLKGEPLAIFFSVATCVLGILALSSALQGWFFGKIKAPLRAALLTASILLFIPFWFAETAIIGVALLGVLTFYKKRQQRNRSTWRAKQNHESAGVSGPQ